MHGEGEEDEEEGGDFAESVKEEQGVTNGGKASGVRRGGRVERGDRGEGGEREEDEGHEFSFPVEIPRRLRKRRSSLGPHCRRTGAGGGPGGCASSLGASSFGSFSSSPAASFPGEGCPPSRLLRPMESAALSHSHHNLHLHPHRGCSLPTHTHMMRHSGDPTGPNGSSQANLTLTHSNGHSNGYTNGEAKPHMGSSEGPMGTPREGFTPAGSGLGSVRTHGFMAHHKLFKAKGPVQSVVPGASAGSAIGGLKSELAGMDVEGPENGHGNGKGGNNSMNGSDSTVGVKGAHGPFEMDLTGSEMKRRAAFELQHEGAARTSPFLFFANVPRTRLRAPKPVEFPHTSSCVPGAPLGSPLSHSFPSAAPVVSAGPGASAVTGAAVAGGKGGGLSQALAHERRGGLGSSPVKLEPTQEPPGPADVSTWGHHARGQGVDVPGGWDGRQAQCEGEYPGHAGGAPMDTEMGEGEGLDASDSFAKMASLVRAAIEEQERRMNQGEGESGGGSSDTSSGDSRAQGLRSRPYSDGAILTQAQEMDYSETDSDSKENLENGAAEHMRPPKKRWAMHS